jgi:prepilin-type N-terminal cleavage/methylation domain-containing protein
MISPTSSRKPNSGFTLVEILLVLAVLVTLGSAMAVSVGVYSHRQDLSGAGEQFATALRMARAESARLGRRLRIDFDSASTDEPYPTVLYEPDPLTQPATFVPLERSWVKKFADERIRVLVSLRSEPRYDDAIATIDPATGEVLHSIDFQPDGSADSAQIVLAPVDEEDGRRVLVTLAAPAGRITAQLFSAEQWQDEGPDLESP